MRANWLIGIVVVGFLLVIGATAAVLDLGRGPLNILLLVGLAAGWIAGKIVKDSGLGLLLNFPIGIVGALIGIWLLRELDLPMNLWTLVVAALMGASVLLFIWRCAFCPIHRA